MFNSLSSSGTSSDLDFIRRSLAAEEEGDDESDGEDTFITFTTMESRCEELFQRGLELKLEGDLEQSVSCFLTCLKAIQECEYFIKLPQTLHHLGGLYRSLEYYDEATEYAKAEKLFNQAVFLEAQSVSCEEGTPSKQKQKRRPFSKRNKPASSSLEANPALYGPLLMKKAEEFDRLARAYSKENKLELALDYCGNSLSIRRTVLGLDHEASLNYFSLLYAGLHKDDSVLDSPADDIRVSVAVNGTPTSSHLLEGHLSNGEQPSNKLVPALYSEQTQSSNVDGQYPLISSGLQSRSSSRTHLSSSASSLRNLTQNGTTAAEYTPNYLEMATKGCTTEMIRTEVCCTSNEKDMLPHSNTLNDAIPEMTNHESDYREEECEGNYIQKELHNKLEEEEKSHKEQSWPMTVAAWNHHHHHHKEGNLCTGVTHKLNLANNLTKLSSELKAPMCVNLDLHPSRHGGEGEESTCCVPLWVLLLPLCLALIAYMLYYH